MGWEMISSIVSNITHPSGTFQPFEHTGLPITRLLPEEEIPALCDRDVADLKESFANATIGAEEVHLAVLPNTDMITYMHRWGDALNILIRGKTPQVHGAICEAADSWIYWHHGFDKLLITRVRTPPEKSHGSIDALAGLLLHAVDEARKWGFPKVIAWEPSPELEAALELVKNKFGVEINTESRPNSITSVRWQGADHSKKTILHLNENYAAS